MCLVVHTRASKCPVAPMRVSAVSSSTRESHRVPVSSGSLEESLKVSGSSDGSLKMFGRSEASLKVSGYSHESLRLPDSSE